MLKKLSKCIREFKKLSIVTLILMVAEAIIETLIPFITADLVNSVKEDAGISSVFITGLILAAMAAASLFCGGMAGYTSAKAAAGFAKNLRSDVFKKVQSFDFKNIKNAVNGTADQSSARYIQFALPRTVKSNVLNITTPTTPHAYIECSLLISRSGFSLGIAAITGLIKTSLNPEATENITVPTTIHKKAISGKNLGKSAYNIKPIKTISGVLLTALCILKCFVKNVNIKSIDSWVKKLITTKKPSNV